LESKALALGVFLESKALGVFLESKALALDVFLESLALAKVNGVLVPKAEALDSRTLIFNYLILNIFLNP
jgi:hypothetical protein